MTVNKIIELLDFISSFYPTKRTEEQKQIVLSFWDETFKDYDDAIVELAVKYCVKRCKFEPKISDVLSTIEDLYRIDNPIVPDFDDVWLAVIKPLARIGNDWHKAFDGLPQIAKNIIKDPYRLKEYAQIDTYLLQTEIKKDFRRSYDDKKKVEEKKAEYAYLLNHPAFKHLTNAKKLIE